MAAFLLRTNGSKALKCVYLDLLGFNKIAPVTFCTKPLEPKKNVKGSKTKVPTSTTEESKEMDFDISTYKNLQHHDYSTYTFVDFDLELAKFRLPQPLSGRK
ncbi:NADH dehydrogenase [ubiquinone] flavoprotein 3, mitochondrial [Erpetoichthys calabaricus]|uniref:NADH dehydrogenase [ubiquinone] flavoprotein 3, mitochondrial n=1 Tax=Erpetoichthys calabaricus TaxID=27687 RepID=UPI002234D225|nr:NADH dehydrogenase [ubiquinone] flavoprotein 3, mitochondrial [Erpetoichthys calabaricus]